MGGIQNGVHALQGQPPESNSLASEEEAEVEPVSMPHK